MVLPLIVHSLPIETPQENSDSPSGDDRHDHGIRRRCALQLGRKPGRIQTDGEEGRNIQCSQSDHRAAHAGEDEGSDAQNGRYGKADPEEAGERTVCNVPFQQECHAEEEEQLENARYQEGRAAALAERIHDLHRAIESSELESGQNEPE